MLRRSKTSKGGYEEMILTELVKKIAHEENISEKLVYHIIREYVLFKEENLNDSN